MAFQITSRDAPPGEEKKLSTSWGFEPSTSRPCDMFSSAVPQQLPLFIEWVKVCLSIQLTEWLKGLLIKCLISFDCFFYMGQPRPNPASLSFIFLFLSKWNQTRIAWARVGRSIHKTTTTATISIDFLIDRLANCCPSQIRGIQRLPKPNKLTEL